MLFTNVVCEIKEKKAKDNGNDYRYIEFGNRENGTLFLACNIKKFSNINIGFHNKLSVAMSKKDNPKIVYSPDDKDLYMLLMGEKNEKIHIADAINSQSKFTIITSTLIMDKDSFTHIGLVKITGDENVTFVFEHKDTGAKRYINVNKKFVKTLTEFDAEGSIEIK